MMKTIRWGLILPLAMLAAAALPGRAQTIDAFVSRSDRTPIVGAEVRFYRQVDNLLISSAVTNGTGYARVEDTTFVGQLRCVDVITREGYLFLWTGVNTPIGANQRIPLCANAHNATYYFWGTRISATALKVIGGQRGYVNPNAGESAELLFTPTVGGPVRVTVYAASGRAIWTTEHSLIPRAQNRVIWSAVDSGGVRVPSGIYHVRVTGSGLDLRSKIAVVRK